MSFSVRTFECFPTVLELPGLPPAQAPRPQHHKCPVGFSQPGLIGGWHCPCPCHRKEADQ